MVLAAASWMNLPNLVPVFAKPHEGSSIRRLSSAFQTLSVCLFFIVTSGRARDHVAWQRAIAHTVCRFHSSSNVGSANSSAHRPTAEAPTPVVSFNCLLARRLVERGVRFVQLYHRGWDNHGTSAHDDIVNRLPQLCRETDQASAALVKDLKQRGLLDNTLVVWGGEFGRTPMNEERNRSKFLGRDHHPRAFSVWLAGGGIKPGVTVGQTDEFGYNAIEDPVDVHDLHATILHLM